jgi:hypothetical protein
MPSRQIINLEIVQRLTLYERAISASVSLRVSQSPGHRRLLGSYRAISSNRACDNFGAARRQINAVRRGVGKTLARIKLEMIFQPARLTFPLGQLARSFKVSAA